jgi:hypothetical protein
MNERSWRTEVESALEVRKPAAELIGILRVVENQKSPAVKEAFRIAGGRGDRLVKFHERLVAPPLAGQDHGANDPAAAKLGLYC